MENLKEGAYPSISVREFEVYGTQDNTSNPSTPVDVNLASASYTNMGLEKLTDGNVNKDGGRWSSEKAQCNGFILI